jgi:hypothetical protein
MHKRFDATAEMLVDDSSVQAAVVGDVQEVSRRLLTGPLLNGQLSLKLKMRSARCY